MVTIAAFEKATCRWARNQSVDDQRVDAVDKDAFGHPDQALPSQLGARTDSKGISYRSVRMGAKASVKASNLTDRRSEEHTSELQSLMRISYAVFCLTKKTTPKA